MAEAILNCPVCGCQLVKPKAVETLLKVKCRVRRFTCSNTSCDYTEMVLAGGNYISGQQSRADDLKKLSRQEREDIKRRRNLNE